MVHSAAATKSILLVDDHPMIRKALANLIESEDDLQVIHEASSAHEALRSIEQDPPDLAIVDLSLKDSNGMELIKDIQIRFPKVKIMVLSMRDEGLYAERALRSGAQGYLTKEEGLDKVLEGVRKILSGQIYVSDALASSIIGKMVGGTAESGDSLMDQLTDRELEVFEFIGRGQATREIAKKLHISPKTVDSHREHIKQKLHLASGADLTKHAIQWIHCQKNM